MVEGLGCEPEEERWLDQLQFHEVRCSLPLDEIDTA